MGAAGDGGEFADLRELLVDEEVAVFEDLDEDVDPQQLREALLKIQKDLVALADSLSTDVQVELDSLEQESKKNRRVALIFMLVVVTASLSIMIFVTTRYISTPLRRMSI